MKTIIVHGRPVNTVRRFICICCGCVFDADKDEYTQVFERNEDYCQSECPECGKPAFSHIKGERRSVCHTTKTK